MMEKSISGPTVPRESEESESPARRDATASPGNAKSEPVSTHEEVTYAAAQVPHATA